MFEEIGTSEYGNRWDC